MRIVTRYQADDGSEWQTAYIERAVTKTYVVWESS